MQHNKQHHRLGKYCSVAFIWMTNLWISCADSNIIFDNSHNLLQNKQHYRNVLLGSFHWKGHPEGFYLLKKANDFHLITGKQSRFTQESCSRGALKWECAISAFYWAVTIHTLEHRFVVCAHPSDLECSLERKCSLKVDFHWCVNLTCVRE